MASRSHRLDDSPFIWQKEKDTEKFILVVQDVFSRKIWAEALVTKQPEEVLRTFKQILEKIREEGCQISDRLTTDAGGEFAGVKSLWVK